MFEWLKFCIDLLNCVIIHFWYYFNYIKVKAFLFMYFSENNCKMTVLDPLSGPS